MQLPLHLTLSVLVCLGLLCSAPPAGASPVPTTTTLAVTSGGSAVTTVTSGSVVTLTATVLAGTTPVTVGQINFCDAAATYCTDVKQLGTAQLTSAGTATFRFRPGVGTHSYNAVFVGTPRGATAYAGSTSSAAALAVTGPGPSITTLAVIPGASSGTYNLTATVGGNGSAAPTGTVSFLDASTGNSGLGTATLGGGTAGLSFLNVTNSELATLNSPTFIAAGDFNGDGIPDLAVVNYYSDSVTILVGNGDGTFTTKSTVQTGPDPVSVAVGDFNGDGVLDLAVPNLTENTVTVLLGNGDGTFSPIGTSPATGAAPESITVADFNGDGILDLAVINVCGNDPNCQSFASTVTILLGNGDGTFTPVAASLAVGDDPESIAVGDFNGDGIPDLAIPNSWNNNVPDDTVTIFLGNGDGTFTPTATSPTGFNPDSIVVGDFNGDGIPDLAVSNALGDNFSGYTSGTVSILLGNGDGTFTPTAMSPATGQNPVSITIADFNGDGIPDLVVANNLDQTLTVLLGQGSGGFPNQETVQLGSEVENTRSVVAADFNGDGVSDLAVQSFVRPIGEVYVMLTANQTGTATNTVALPSGSGIQQVLASYTGDTNYRVSTSGTTALNPITPTVNVKLSSSSILSTQSLTVTVTVSGPPGNPTATGPVTLTSGSYSSGPMALSGGAAQISIGPGTLPAGNDTLTVNYTPDANGSNFYTSASGTGIVVVTASTLFVPAVTVTPSSSSITNTQALTVTVAVVGVTGKPTPTGSVTLISGSYNSGGIALSGGAAQINITAGALAVGSDTLTIYFVPDSASSTVYASASGTSTVVVTGYLATVTVTPLSTSVLTTQALQVDVTVSGPSGDPIPTGLVTLSSGSYTSPATTLSGGSAQINIPAGSLTTGTDTLTVNYTPDASSSTNYNSASGTSTVVVNLPTPTVTVTPASLNITSFQTLTVTVSLSGPAGSPVPTGSVKLTGGSYTSPAATLSSGTTSITIPAGALSLGADTLTASYTPDSASSTFYAAATGSSSVTVNAVAPTVLVSPASKTLVVSQALSVVVAVSGPSGGPTATGSVTLTGGGYTSAATTLSSGSATINIPANSLSVGSDTLTVTYAPDSGSPGYTSASGTSTVVVSSLTPTVTVTPLATSILTTQALQVNVSVSGPAGDATPTGSVDLTSGSYDSGAVTLSGGSAAISVPAGSLGVGNDTLSVSYTPDSASIAIYSSSTGTGSVTVTAPNPAPAVSSMSPAVETAGDATFTLTVNGSGFTSGSTAYWGTSALTTLYVSSGQVTAQVPASDIASSGTDSVSVQNPSPGGGTSNVLQFEVDSSGSGSPSFGASTATVTPGQSATYSVTLPSAATAVMVNCLNLPGGASCSYSSTGNTVTIATTSSTPAGTYQVTVVFTETVAGAATSFIFLPVLLLPFARIRRKWTAGKIWFTACLGVALLVASTSIGCGGSSSGPPPPPITHQVTTSGVVTLTVQ
jgi:hypothetical protein